MRGTVFNEALVQKNATVHAWVKCRGSEQLVLLRKRGNSNIHWLVGMFRETTGTFDVRPYARFTRAWLYFTSQAEMQCLWYHGHE